MKLYENIRKRREQLNLSQTELAERVGYKGKTMISKIENGEVDLSQSKIKAFAEALNTTASALMGESEHQELYITYKVLGDIKCGYGGIAEYEETGDEEDIPASWIHGDDRNNFVVLEAKSDSLYPYICEGDRVLIHKVNSVPSGTLAAVLIGEEITLKRVFYVPGENWIRLEGYNPSYPPKTIKGADLENVRIFGEAKRFIRII